jgi:photosystem II stability/assembly factor-like uncharacterized protein
MVLIKALLTGLLGVSLCIMKKNVWYRGVILVGLLAIMQTASADWQHSSAAQGVIYSLAVSGTNIFAGGHGILFSSDTGTSWTLVDSGLPTPTNVLSVFSLAASGTNIFAGTYGHGVFLSTNNGTTWTAIDSGLPSKTTDVYYLLVNGTNVLAGAPSHGVFLSTNNGTSWTAVDSGLPQNTMYSNTIKFLAGNGTTLFTGIVYGGIFLSTNNGASWTAVDSGFISNVTVHALAAIGTNLFAATDNRGVFLSINNGATWTSIDSGLPLPSNTYYPSFTSLAVSGTNLFTTTLAGVYLSTDNGKSWTNVSPGLGSLMDGPACLAISGRYLIAGSSSGLWRRPLSEMLSATPVIPYNQNTPALQTKLRVSASVTAHAGIKVNYSLASRCKVQLGIYTIAGEKLVSLEQGEQAPGTFSVSLPADKIQAGLYICRFQAGNRRESALVRVMK